MLQIEKPADELDRLAALYELGKLDTPAEERFDRFTRQVARLLDVPIAYLALLDAERQWLKSSVGPMECEMDRSLSFCSHTILQPEPLVVRDAREDPRFADNPLVTKEPKIRFYAGVPLVGPGGHRVGTFCVADVEPRDLSAADLAILERFAGLVTESLNQPPRVFVSYSHRDEEWKDRLLAHLAVLQEQGLVELWEDRRIQAGSEWSREIEEAMEASTVAVLLVTASYLTSRFILDVEVPRLLQRRDREGIEVFPVIVKPCCWDRVDWLARLNLRPRDAKPLASENERRIEDLLAALSGEIVDLCKPARAQQARVPERPRPAPAPAPEPSAAPPRATGAPEPAPGRPAAAEAPAAPGAGIESVIVLPFADLTGDRDLSFLCDGLVDELIHALTGVPGLRVASQISTFQFKSREVEPEELRRRMGVGAAVQGSVQRAGERLRIGVRLVHLDGGFNLWSQRFEGSLDDVFALQDQVAGGVVAALDGRTGEPAGGVRRRRDTEDAETYRLYVEGRQHWNRRTEESLQKSLGCFHRAVAREPGFARAHAGLALAYITLSSYGTMAPDDAMPAARKAARRALEIDPGLSVVHCCLGVISALYDRAWEAAEEEFRRALAQSPEEPGVRHWYAMNFLIPAGRFEEAGRELDKVLELDPLSLVAGASVGIRLYFKGRFQEAVQRFEEVLGLEPDFPMARLFLAQSLTELGRFEEAVRELRTASAGSAPASPELTAALGYAFGRSGDAEGARRLLRELAELSALRYVSPSLSAQVLAGLGEREAALDRLEEAAELRASDLAWLRVRPAFRSLAEEPRFRALVARHRLP